MNQKPPIWGHYNLLPKCVLLCAHLTQKDRLNTWTAKTLNTFKQTKQGTYVNSE